MWSTQKSRWRGNFIEVLTLGNDASQKLRNFHSSYWCLVGNGYGMLIVIMDHHPILWPSREPPESGRPKVAPAGSFGLTTVGSARLQMKIPSSNGIPGGSRVALGTSRFLAEEMGSAGTVVLEGVMFLCFVSDFQ